MKVSRKKMTGVVVSRNMKKTVVVAVSRTFRHPRYQKYMHGVRTYKVHDERDACLLNDVVEIVETRPLSREKRWRVLRILEHAKIPPEGANSAPHSGRDRPAMGGSPIPRPGERLGSGPAFGGCPGEAMQREVEGDK